ncbi:MAG: precorrin-4 C(11)-methyltransferase [Thermodesulfobacteriota bacterium]
MKRYPILFVGAGPGDPELITVKGRRALEEADRVLFAGSLVPEAVLAWAGPRAHCVSSAPMNLEETTGFLEEGYRAGLKVVRLHSGDPSIYGAIREQMDRLSALDIPFSVIPGVTSALAAAAAMHLEFTVPESTQTLVITRMEGLTPVPEREALAQLARHGSSMAIYLSASLAGKVAEALAPSYGADAPAAVAFRVSQPDQKIVSTTVGELPEVLAREGITRQALIIVGPALEKAANDKASRLYDPSFSHGFRKGRNVR